MYNCNNVSLRGALTSKPYAFSARSWELEKLDFIDFYDGMLSNIAIDVRGLSIMRVLPRINENLNEEWISDKIRFSYDAFRRQRLLTPLYKNEKLNSFEEVSWEESFFIFFFKYNINFYDYINSDNFEVLYGKFIDLESFTISKDFFNSFKESSVSLSYADYSKMDNTFNSNFLLNFKMKELSNIDFSLIIGSNVRYENPVLHLKLLRLANQGVPLFTFACSSTMKFKNYSLGNSIANLFNYIKGKNKYSLLFTKAKKPIVFMGESLIQRIDGKLLVRLFNLFKIKQLNISHIYTNASKIGGLSLGIFDTFVNKNKGSFLYLYNSDDVNVKKTMFNFIIYQGHHGDHGSSISNLILPSTFLLEKKGTFLNMEGHFIPFNFIMKPGVSVRTDWRIFKALSLYFKNNLTLFKNNFKDLNLTCFHYLPNYLSKNKKETYFFTQNVPLRLNNSLYYSYYIEYFLSDSVSRASRVMSVSAVKFKNYFFNF